MPTSGWEWMGDLHLIELVNHRMRWDSPIPEEAVAQMTLRGLKVRTCSECGWERIHQDHDYMCFTCRRSTRVHEFAP